MKFVIWLEERMGDLNFMCLTHDDLKGTSEKQLKKMERMICQSKYISKHCIYNNKGYSFIFNHFSPHCILSTY